MRKKMRRGISQIESFEPMVLMSATVIEGTNASEWISGDHNDNSIFAGGGNDEIHAPLGTNTIDGGSCEDTLVIYEGARADYSVQQLANGSVLLTGRGLNGSTVQNTLINVERILFNDGALAFNSSGSEQTSPSTSNSTPIDVSPSTADPVQNTPAPAPSAPVEPSGTQTISGTDIGEWINGTNANDTIIAKGGNDDIYAPLGRNFIDGGSGVDTLVIYQGRFADYQLVRLQNGNTQLTGPGLDGQQVVNELQNVERIHFLDQIYNLDSAQNSPSGSSAAADTGSSGAGQLQTAVPQPLESFSPEPLPLEPLPLEPLPLEQQTPEPQPSEPAFQPQVEPSQPVETNTQPAQSVNVTSPAENTGSNFLTEVVRLTNIIRAQNGLSPLSVSSQLQQAAQTQSENLAFQDFFSHTGLDGLQPWDRAENAGYNYRAIGENIAAGQRTPAEVVQAWVDSPSHLANILNPVFTEIGIGYQYLANDTGNINFNYYWTQVFGTRL